MIFVAPDQATALVQTARNWREINKGQSVDQQIKEFVNQVFPVGAGDNLSAQEQTALDATILPLRRALELLDGNPQASDELLGQELSRWSDAEARKSTVSDQELDGTMSVFFGIIIRQIAESKAEAIKAFEDSNLNLSKDQVELVKEEMKKDLDEQKVQTTAKMIAKIENAVKNLNLPNGADLIERASQEITAMVEEITGGTQAALTDGASHKWNQQTMPAFFEAHRLQARAASPAASDPSADSAQLDPVVEEKRVRAVVVRADQAERIGRTNVEISGVARCIIGQLYTTTNPSLAQQERNNKIDQWFQKQDGRTWVQDDATRALPASLPGLPGYGTGAIFKFAAKQAAEVLGVQYQEAGGSGALAGQGGEDGVAFNAVCQKIGDDLGIFERGDLIDFAGLDFLKLKEKRAEKTDQTPPAKSNGHGL